MKFILPVIAFFLLCSCAGLFYTNPEEQIYGASEVKVDFFEEWGLFRITGYGVVSKRAGRFDDRMLLPTTISNQYGLVY